jgi:coenzyme F420-reducing hydrogenase alpha subunit
MSRNAHINVHHVTRVEGHGNIVLNVREGRIEELRLEIVESPRFFEAMLLGRSYEDAPGISARICGICSVGHTTTSLRAMESALGVTPSEQTVKLRKICFYGEQLQSHILHVYFLVAPDLFGVGSVIPLAATHGDVVRRALRLKRDANAICERLAGRHVHPVALKVMGFSRLPTEDDLRAVQAMLQEEMLPDLQATVDLFAGLKLPVFERETEYVSLKSAKEYAFYEGDIYSSDTGPIPVRDYRGVTNEMVVAHSSAKHAKHVRESYMVGALARFNNNHEQLTEGAKRAAGKLGLKAPCHNPFMINVAQVVESVHCAEEALRLTTELLEAGLNEENGKVAVRAGRGIGACEVPRGVLFHEYAIDEHGLIEDCNLVIPTSQNCRNIEQDLHALVPQILDRSEAEITLNMEMLVRAYDPCISCSAHLLDVKFV